MEANLGNIIFNALIFNILNLHNSQKSCNFGYQKGKRKPRRSPFHKLPAGQSLITCYKGSEKV